MSAGPERRRQAVSQPAASGDEENASAAPEPAPGDAARMKKSQAISMAVCVAFGFAYFAWVAFTEGWRFWLVASLVATVGALGFVAHRAMGVGRR